MLHNKAYRQTRIIRNIIALPWHTFVTRTLLSVNSTGAVHCMPWSVTTLDCKLHKTRHPAVCKTPSTVNVAPRLDNLFQQAANHFQPNVPCCCLHVDPQINPSFLTQPLTDSIASSEPLDLPSLSVSKARSFRIWITFALCRHDK